MSDRIRQTLAFVIAMGMVIAVAGAPTVAQTAEEAFGIAAGVNADKVDGKHAVGASTSKRNRAWKLVATDGQGFLPSNIVKPAWKYVKNKPRGFADGVDNVGITDITITRKWGEERTVAAGGGQFAQATCPSGSNAIAGGYHADGVDVNVHTSFMNGPSAWRVNAWNPTQSDHSVKAFVVCVSNDLGGGFASTSQGVRPAGLYKSSR